MNEKTYTGLPSVTITLGDQEIEGFKMPDESWVTSVSGMARCLNIPRRTAGDFLCSDWLKQAQDNGLQPATFQISTEINPVPIVAIPTRQKTISRQLTAL